MFGFMFILMAAATIVSIWGIVDAATQPDAAWVASNQNKVLWIALQVVGMFVCLGFVFTIVYFLTIRPQVLAQR